MSDCVSTHTFIVRIWKDSSQPSARPAWRGMIDHVGCEGHLVFFDLEAIPRFIQESTGLPLYHRPRWWQALLRRLRLR